MIIYTIVKLLILYFSVSCYVVYQCIQEIINKTIANLMAEEYDIPNDKAGNDENEIKIQKETIVILITNAFHDAESNFRVLTTDSTSTAVIVILNMISVELAEKYKDEIMRQKEDGRKAYMSTPDDNIE